MARLEHFDELTIAFRQLTEAAETFVNRAPKLRRLDAQRTALLDAISHAQLVLSVSRLSTSTIGDESRTVEPRNGRTMYDKQLREWKDKIQQLELRLGTVTAEQESAQQKIEGAKGLLESVTKHPARVLPFKRIR